MSRVPNRRVCLDMLACMLLLLICSSTAAAPNILVFLADDAGAADFGTQPGSPDFDLLTPAIDSIAFDGVRFSAGYVTGAQCSPTRAGFVTGRYQQRFGHSNNTVQRFEYSGLPANQMTVMENMQALGYRTYCVGKWHLGNYAASDPNTRGCDEFLGFLEGARSYFALPGPTFVKEILRNGSPEFPDGEPADLYTTDLWGDEAIAYIDDHVQNHAGSPFFMLLSFNAVHVPMDADPERLADPRVQAVMDDPRRPERQKLAAMMLAMDENVDKVLEHLDALALTDETLVVFFNDNGGAELDNSSNNGVLSGRKGYLKEGGVRVPFFMRWPGVIPAGQTIDDPVIQLDLLPTFVSAAGGLLPPEQVVDGVDLLPRVTGETQSPPHTSLFWRTRGSTVGESAVRKDNWKLFRRDAVGGGSVQLYDLDTDIQETNDLAATQSQKLDELLADLTAWESEIIEPLWGVGLETNTGEIVLKGGAIPAPSELGYEFSNDGPQFGHGLIRQRFPLATDEDWRLRFEMDLVEVEGLAQRGFVVLSPDADLSQSIRMGVTVSPPKMSIIEVATGDVAVIDLALPPVGPSEYTIDFDSSENSLTMTWDDQTVTHVLATAYEQFGYAGYAVRESRSRFSNITRDPDAVAPASARH